MLKISTKARYGLRALSELAAHHGEGPLSMQSIAERQGLSRKYLHALLSSLREAGFVRSVRGAAGGYELVQPPEEIMLDAVFTALEGPICLVDCQGEDCHRGGQCATGKLWKKLSALLSDALGKMSLRDLLQLEGLPS